MSEQEPIFDPTRLEADRRRYEWISVPEMGRICVRELLLPENMLIVEYATRPSIDPRGGIDQGEMTVWEIALSCYDGEGERARRIFDDHQLHLVKRLRWPEYRQIRDAIQRVNGESAEEAELLRDFTAAGQAADG